MSRESSVTTVSFQFLAVYSEYFTHNYFFFNFYDFHLSNNNNTTVAKMVTIEILCLNVFSLDILIWNFIQFQIFADYKMFQFNGKQI